MLWTKDINFILNTNPPIATISVLAGIFARRNKPRVVMTLFDQFKSRGIPIPGVVLNAMCHPETCLHRFSYVIDKLPNYDVPVGFQCLEHGNNLLWGVSNAKAFKAFVRKGVDVRHVNRMGQTILWRMVWWRNERLFNELKSQKTFRGHINVAHRDNNGQSIFYRTPQVAILDPIECPETVATKDVLLTPDNTGKLSVHVVIDQSFCIDKLLSIFKRYVGVYKFILRIPYKGEFPGDRVLTRHKDKILDDMIDIDHIAVLLPRLDWLKYRKVYTLKTCMLLHLFRNYDACRDLIMSVPEGLLYPGEPFRDIDIENLVVPLLDWPHPPLSWCNL